MSCYTTKAMGGRSLNSTKGLSHRQFLRQLRPQLHPKSLERRVFCSGSLIVGRATYHVYMPKTRDV